MSTPGELAIAEPFIVDHLFAQKYACIQFSTRAFQKTTNWKSVLAYSDQLLDISQRFGVLALASSAEKAAFYVASIKSIVNHVEEDKRTQNAQQQEDIPQGNVFVPISVPHPFWHLSFNSTDELLAVCMKNEVYIYSIQQFCELLINPSNTSNVSLEPLLKVSIANNLSDSFVQFIWSKSTPNICATVSSATTLAIYDLPSPTPIISQSINNITFASWGISPNSLWVTTDDGEASQIIQYSISDKKSLTQMQEFSVDCPSDSGDRWQVHFLYEIEDDSLLLGYRQLKENNPNIDPNDAKTCCYSLSQKKLFSFEDTVSDIDAFLVSDEERLYDSRHRFHFSFLNKWKCGLLWSNKCINPRVLAYTPSLNIEEDVSSKWVPVEPEEETRKISIPSDEDYTPTYPLGIGVDTSNEKSITQHVPVSMPYPFVFILTSDARLHIYSFLNTQIQSPTAPNSVMHVAEPLPTNAFVWPTSTTGSVESKASPSPSPTPPAFPQTFSFSPASSSLVSLPATTSAMFSFTVTPSAPFSFGSAASSSFSSSSSSTAVASASSKPPLFSNSSSKLIGSTTSATPFTMSSAPVFSSAIQTPTTTVSMPSKTAPSTPIPFAFTTASFTFGGTTYSTSSVPSCSASSSAISTEKTPLKNTASVPVSDRTNKPLPPPLSHVKPPLVGAINNKSTPSPLKTPLDHNNMKPSNKDIPTASLAKETPKSTTGKPSAASSSSNVVSSLPPAFDSKPQTTKDSKNAKLSTPNAIKQVARPNSANSVTSTPTKSLPPQVPSITPIVKEEAPSPVFQMTPMKKSFIQPEDFMIPTKQSNVAPFLDALKETATEIRNTNISAHETRRLLEEAQFSSRVASSSLTKESINMEQRKDGKFHTHDIQQLYMLTDRLQQKKKGLDDSLQSDSQMIDLIKNNAEDCLRQLKYGLMICLQRKDPEYIQYLENEPLDAYSQDIKTRIEAKQAALLTTLDQAENNISENWTVLREKFMGSQPLNELQSLNVARNIVQQNDQLIRSLQNGLQLLEQRLAAGDVFSASHYQSRTPSKPQRLFNSAAADDEEPVSGSRSRYFATPGRFQGFGRSSPPSNVHSPGQYFVNSPTSYGRASSSANTSIDNLRSIYADRMRSREQDNRLASEEALSHYQNRSRLSQLLATASEPASNSKQFRPTPMSMAPHARYQSRK